jgi:hypothetical protein
MLSDHAANRVGGAARTKWNDDRDRLARIGFRMPWQARQEDTGNKQRAGCNPGENPQRIFHPGSSLIPACSPRLLLHVPGLNGTQAMAPVTLTAVLGKARQRPLALARLNEQSLASAANLKFARSGGFGIGTLVPRTRSSHNPAARVAANFGFKSGTRNIELLVSL